MVLAVTTLLVVATQTAPALAQSGPDASGRTAADPADDTICTDRPTKSSGACTVPGGHLQLEADLFNGSFQRQGGVTTDTYLATNPTLKYGVGAALDLEAALAPYEVVRTHDRSGATGVLGGIGDLNLRVKWNAYNSGDGRFSFAAIPSLTLPTARRGISVGAVEGGLLLPISYKVTDKLQLTTMPEFDANVDEAGGGRHFSSAQLVSASYALPHDVSVYGELWGQWDHDPSGTVRQVSADLAISQVLHKTLQLDAGLNFGLNRATPGVQAYLGVSQRF